MDMINRIKSKNLGYFRVINLYSLWKPQPAAAAAPATALQIVVKLVLENINIASLLTRGVVKSGLCGYK